jgi:transposase
MPPEKFDALLDMVAPKIERQNTQMRDAISPRVMLEVTLYFMATGNSYRNLQYFFRVSKASISNFIPEVCDAIYDSLREFIKVSK